MKMKENMTREFILVGMGKAEISTEDKPIIGTQALATCIGVLLYSEEMKKAIVAHVAPAQTDIIQPIVKLMIDNNLVDTPIKCMIIPGYYEEHYGTKQFLEKNFKCYKPFESKEITDNSVRTNEEFTSREFAFDTRTGKFVTDQVFFGIDYKTINNNPENNSKSRGR